MASRFARKSRESRDRATARIGAGSAAFTFRLHRSGLRASLRRIPRREIPSTDFCAQRKRPAGRGRWLCSSRRSTRRNDARRSTLRAICEASRGRQLRLIRAETDSGRSDGLLNALTCRQPSARDFTSSVVDDVTELFAPIAPSKLRVSFPVNPFAIFRVLWVKADTRSYIF